MLNISFEASSYFNVNIISIFDKTNEQWVHFKSKQAVFGWKVNVFVKSLKNTLIQFENEKQTLD